MFILLIFLHLFKVPLIILHSLLEWLHGVNQLLYGLFFLLLMPVYGPFVFAYGILHSIIDELKYSHMEDLTYPDEFLKFPGSN